MSTPILATKLYIPPPRPKAVPRPRLIEQLNQGLHLGHKLTLISAPAGFGKTTLASEWLASLNTGSAEEGQIRHRRSEAATSEIRNQVAWLSLDEGDDDPTRFLTYLIAALQTVSPAIGEGTLQALQSPQPPPAESILTNLLNEITAVPKRQAILLVLDDYHLIDTSSTDDASSVDDALAFLVEHLPPTMHLVITTREDPPLPLPRLRARGQLTELRAADLRFTPDESAVFLNQAMGLNLAAGDIAALEDRTEGWIAGLQMAGLSMQGRTDSAAFVQAFTGSHHFVLDYLIEEVLEQQPQSVQTFLLKTSVLERLTGPLCDAVLFRETAHFEEMPGNSSGIADGRQMLQYLQQANLFIVPLDNERRWYRYHHLFADLLRQRLRRQGSDEVAELHGRASIWYEENGLEIEAFHHAAAANDIERAERLVEGEDTPLYYRGAGAPVLHWLESLPVNVLDARPSLWLIYAWALWVAHKSSQVEEKLQAAQAALQGIDQDEATQNLMGQIAALRAMLAANEYDAQTIITQSRLALKHLHPDDLSVRTAVTRTLGYAYHLQGDRTAARHAYTETIKMCEASGNIFINILATTALGIIQEAENELHPAAETYRRVLQLVGDPPGPVACEAYFGLGRISYEWDNQDTAQEQVELSVQLSRHIESIDRFVAGEVFLARLKLAQGDLDGAAGLLTQADQSARRHNFVQQIPEIAAVRVLMLLHQGNLAGAAQLAQKHHLPFSQARVHLAQGDPNAALAVLEPLRQEMDARDWADERLKVMVLQTLALQANGQEEEALQLLGEALALAEPGGHIRTFVDEGPPMAQLLPAAAARAIMPDYTNKLLSAFSTLESQEVGITKTTSDIHKQSGVSKAATSEMVEPLTPRELEVLHLIAQGLSNREISERLFLALSTVKGHNRIIFGKLQVKNRTEAVARARELGLL